MRKLHPCASNFSNVVMHRPNGASCQLIVSHVQVASPNKTFSIEEPGQAVQNALVGCSPGFCFRNLFTNQINYSRLCQEEVPLTAVSFATTTSTATQRWADMHNHPCVAAHTLLYQDVVTLKSALAGTLVNDMGKHLFSISRLTCDGHEVADSYSQV